MLCENCKKNTATTYLKQTVNGKTSEIFLCSDCAAKLGLGETSSFMGFDSVLPKFFETRTPQTVSKCPTCGMSANEFSRGGKVGCESCYDHFKAMLAHPIQRFHGNNKKHIGKRPASLFGKAERKTKNLREALEQAIATENFEEAAKLRDQIRALESKGGNQDEA